MSGLKDEMADLSPEERQAAMKQARAEALDELLADGTITQEIYDKMMAASAGMGRGDHAGMWGPRLDQALENGDITQAEYDAMKAIQEKMSGLKDEMADLSSQERQAAMKEARAEALDELLTDGTITPEIYDKMMAVPNDRVKGKGCFADGLGGLRERPTE